MLRPTQDCGVVGVTSWTPRAPLAASFLQDAPQGRERVLLQEQLLLAGGQRGPPHRKCAQSAPSIDASIREREKEEVACLQREKKQRGTICHGSGLWEKQGRTWGQGREENLERSKTELGRDLQLEQVLWLVRISQALKQIRFFPITLLFGVTFLRCVQTSCGISQQSIFLNHSVNPRTQFVM